MGKSKRKGKEKEDFKRKKLKVGKHLPIPDNTTTTSFKTRSININIHNPSGTHPSTRDDEATYFKRHMIKDLLSSCSHYNAWARKDALNGLKDVIVKHPSALKDNIHGIFQKTLNMITDNSDAVRQSFLAFCHAVFQTLSKEEIAPFFPNVVAYLCSAMTHLDEDIRMDSLKFLDHCLTFYPKLLSGHSKNVIDNFVDIISSSKDDGGATSSQGSSKKKKAKVISQSTQLEVLTRLRRLLREMSLVQQQAGDDDDAKNGDTVGGQSGDSVGGRSGDSVGGQSGDTVGGQSGDTVGQQSGDRESGSPCGLNTAVSEDSGNAASDCSSGDYIRSDALYRLGSSGLLSPSRFSGHGDFSFEHTTPTSDAEATSGLLAGSSIVRPDATTGSPDGRYPDVTPMVDKILVSDFSLENSSTTSDTMSTNLFTDEITLQEFITTISSVLFEFWIECCPAEFVINLVPVNKKSLPLKIMKEVLEIFVTLLETLESISTDREVFLAFIRGSLLKQFKKHFIPVFPMFFTIQEEKEKVNATRDPRAERMSDITLNLLMCELLCRVIPDSKKETGASEWITRIFQYLEKLLADSVDSCMIKELPNFKKLLKLMTVLLFDFPPCYDNVISISLLENMHQFFESCSSTAHLQRVLFNFLEDILMHLVSKSVCAEIKDIIDTWLVLLVNLFFKRNFKPDIAHTIVAILKQAVEMHNFTKLKTVFDTISFHVFHPKFFLNFADDTKLLLIELLYHLNQAPSRDVYEALSMLCNSGQLSIAIYNYLMQVVHHLAHLESAQTSYYLDFMLSAIIGKTDIQMHAISLCYDSNREHFSELVNNEYRLIITEPQYAQVEETVEKDTQSLQQEWLYQRNTIAIVCKYLTLTDYSAELVDPLVRWLAKFFIEFKTLPVNIVYRLLGLSSVLLSRNKEKSDHHSIVHSHLGKWCALLWCFVLSLKPESTNVQFFLTIVNDVKNISREIFQLSAPTLQSLLQLVDEVPFDAISVDYNLVCRMVTDVLKSGVISGQEERSRKTRYRLCLRSIQEKFVRTVQTKLLDKQIFSDFVYQYSIYITSLVE